MSNRVHLPNINTSPNGKKSEDTSSINGSPGKNNSSNLSQINSSSNEDENLMRTKRLAPERDATLTIPSPGLQQHQKLIKQDSDTPNEDVPSGPVGIKGSIADFMDSKIIDLTSLLLIMIYLGITLVNVLLDHYSYLDNADILSGIQDLKYLEIAVMGLFVLEILVKLYSFGIETYVRTWSDIFDICLSFLILALVAVCISGDKSDDPYNTYVGPRAALRLLRVMFLTRKISQFSKITRTKIKPANAGIKSNVEKVLELLDNLKNNLKDKRFENEIDWANDIISNNKLYEPVMDSSNINKIERSGVGQWFRSWGNNYVKSENKKVSKVNAREQGRRLSLLGASMNKDTVRANGSTTVPKEVVDRLDVEADLFTFDVFAFKEYVKGNELVYTISYLFQRHNMFELLRIEEGVFTAFMKRVQNGYFDNPYHNYLHALDVLQTTNYFLTTGKYIEIADLSTVEVASMYIAASIHDFEHPGTNNIFQMNTGSIYALRYNDKAVLENHHVAACFELMKDSKLNILANLSKSDYKTIRERIVAMVLSTDMSQHFADIGKLKGRIATEFSVKEKDKNFTMEVIVHAADISNPTKSWNTCKEWTFRITQEFFNQGDRERDMKLPITALCDKYTTNVAKSQIGFIDFVVSPLFVLIKEILPQIDISHLESNKNNWKDLIGHYDEELVKLNEKKDEDEKEKATQKVLG